MARYTLPWGRNSVMALLQLVEPFPCLWNPNDPDYKNISIKVNRFRCVCDDLKALFPELKELTPDIVKNKLGSLRTYYLSEVKRIQSMQVQSGNGGRINSRWEYFDNCSFMQETEVKPNMKLTPKTQNVNEEASSTSSAPTPPVVPPATPNTKTEGRKKRKISSETETHKKKAAKDDQVETIHNMLDCLWGQLCCTNRKNKFVKATWKFLAEFEPKCNEGSCPGSSGP